jgi:aspartate-semialdehyde dehydrogenase
MLASKNSIGQHVSFGVQNIAVTELDEHSFDKVDVAFFASSNDISKKFIPIATQKGCLCIDKSSAFRENPEVPLVVAEVNPEKLKNNPSKVIASPNCTTTPLVQVLKPLNDAFGLVHVFVSTYQAVSGAGKSGILALEDELAHKDMKSEHSFMHPIASNLIPAIPASFEGLYSEEESKLVNESRKILGLPELAVSVTCVRVPVFNGHSEAVHVTLKRKTSLQEVRAALEAAPGLLLVDDTSAGRYPMPIDASGIDPTLVGRLRPDPGLENGFALWLSSDNVRTGAALNAVKIAELIFSE